MTAASGVQMTGSPLNALATTFFGTEEDAALIRSAGNIAELNKLSEAALTRVQAGASAATFRYKGYGSLLSGASGRQLKHLQASYLQELVSKPLPK